MDTLTLPEGVDSVAWDSYVIHETDEYREIAVEEYDVKEKIIALAMDAQATGDGSELVAYLHETGLYNKFQDISNKYNIEQHTKNLRMRRKAVNIDVFSSTKYIDGDIFLKYNPNEDWFSPVVDVVVSGHWGHAAFLDVEKRKEGTGHFLLSASNATDEAEEKKIIFKKTDGKVGYDKTVSYWTGSKEVAITRVNLNSNETYKRRRAIEHARTFIGRDFSLFTSREANDKFYCSKVVYRGWLSQGIELEGKDGWTKGLEFWRWNKSKLIPYPEFKVVWWKDGHVTPSDLDATSNTTRLDCFNCAKFNIN
jgi:hypothetical protein